MPYSEYHNIRVAAMVTAIPENKAKGTGIPLALKEQTVSGLGFMTVSRILKETDIVME